MNILHQCSYSVVFAFQREEDNQEKALKASQIFFCCFLFSNVSCDLRLLLPNICSLLICMYVHCEVISMHGSRTDCMSYVTTLGVHAPL